MNLIWLLACASPLRSGPCTVDLDGPIVVAATAEDFYATGGLAAASLDGTRVCDVATMTGDPDVDVVGDVVYAIERRGGDVVRRYDDLTTPPTWEVSTGELSNPYAVVGNDQRLMVPRLAEARLLVLDAEDGSEQTTIDLTPWADADGIPEAAFAVFEGDRGLVLLQRMDRGDGWTPAPTANVVGVDLTSGNVAFDLSVGPNPVMVAHPDGGAVVADEAGGWWRVEMDGTVEGPFVDDALGLVREFSIATDGRVVAVERDCTSCAEHTVVCREAWNGPVTARTEPWPMFFSDVLVVDDTIWLAARRGWEDTVALGGGYVTMPLATCGPVPEPETWLRGTFAPFSLDLRR
ncbi:MAG: hypothetical protein AAF211_32615 [Myxococcota bacterium]